MPTRFQIELANRQSGVRIDRPALLALARRVLRAEGATGADVAVAIVGDREMARLNRQFLNHRGTTDVLTFDLSDATGSGLCAGQIIVCADVARRQAKAIGHSIRAELAFYVAHGLLHLLGHDDATPDQRARMLDRQRTLLAAAGLTLRG